MAMRPPLPVRDGINATRLHLPLTGPWPTISAYMVERFGHVDPEQILRRFRESEVVGIGGAPLTPDTPLGEHEFIWYYRTPPAEPEIPFEISILHEDERLVVIDKPPFLPTTPGGRFVRQSALVRLRALLGEEDLTPLHRLDRLTMGVVMFVRTAEHRGAYQTMFERKQISKQYEAIASAPPEPLVSALEGEGIQVRNRLNKIRDQLRAFEEEGPANAHSTVQLIRRLPPLPLPAPQQDAAGAGQDGLVLPLAGGVPVPPYTGERALYRLTPHTGKTHQLRLHMASLGLGIENDPFYPVLWDEREDDFSRPLKLLARQISFEDPISGMPRGFRSQLDLNSPPAGLLPGKLA